MKLKNTTDFPDYFLRRLVSWCCRQLDYPVRQLRAAEFTKTRHAFCGRAWSSRRILVRIGEDTNIDGAPRYPRERKYPDRKYAPTCTLQDRIEALIKVTAHELAHLSRWNDGVYRNREARVDGMAIAVLEKFRVDRDKLMEAWSEVPKHREAKPKPSRQEQNAQRAAASLATWERKLKLARTKVAKYKKQVNRYERIAASRNT